MATWKRGRQLLQEQALRDDPELLPLIESLAGENLPRSPRTAVYAVADPSRAPQALLHNVKHNAVLHERNVVLTVSFRDEPMVPADAAVAVEPLGHGFWRVRVAYGFMETPDIPAALDACREHGLDINLFAVSYFLSRAIVVPRRGASMAHWRESLFATMARNAGSVAEFFRLPPIASWSLGTGCAFAPNAASSGCCEADGRELQIVARDREYQSCAGCSRPSMLELRRPRAVFRTLGEFTASARSRPSMAHSDSRPSIHKDGRSAKLRFSVGADPAKDSPADSMACSLLRCTILRQAPSRSGQVP